MLFFFYRMDTTVPKVLQKLKTHKEIISNYNKTGASYYLTLDILQSYNKQNDLYWHLKKTHRPMETMSKPRNKSVHLWSVDYLHTCQEHTTWEGSVFNI